MYAVCTMESRPLLSCFSLKFSSGNLPANKQHKQQVKSKSSIKQHDKLNSDFRKWIVLRFHLLG